MTIPVRRAATAAACAVAIGGLTLGAAPASQAIADPNITFQCAVPLWVTPIYGTDGPDVIYGTSGPDVIYAGDGADTVYGNGGNDVIFGGKGADRLYGGEGNDCLVGEKGHDVLDGGFGTDRLYGGEGDDTLSTGMCTTGQGDETADGGPGTNFLAFDWAGTYTNFSTMFEIQAAGKYCA
jgi:Ca2+-binding RTX toxin-like protein